MANVIAKRTARATQNQACRHQPLRTPRIDPVARNQRNPTIMIVYDDRERSRSARSRSGFRS